MKFTFRSGLDLALEGAPEQVLHDAPPVASVAILGHDYPGIRPDFRVAEGDMVITGQVLFTDRRRPRLCFTAPATGRLGLIDTGHRRKFGSLVISVEGEEFQNFAQVRAVHNRGSLSDVLLASGLWTSFRTRPFGRLPDPDTVPAAIFVTAMATDPLAANAAVVIGLHKDRFRRGLDAITLLCDGPVFVCQAPGPDLATSGARIHLASFAGPHPAGLPGTHIHHLMPVSADRTVWHIDYQDVLAIGHLLDTGKLWTERTVALGGPGLRRPRLMRTRLGAKLRELVADEIGNDPVELVSGSLLSGAISAFLGRYHTQVSVLPQGRLVRHRSALDRALGWLPGVSHSASPGPTISLESLDSAMPLDILAVPLMRALSIGDVETAQRLGCLELVEEDVALLSWLCPGRTDYGALLRQTLDELEGGAP